MVGFETVSAKPYFDLRPSENGFQTAFHLPYWKLLTRQQPPTPPGEARGLGIEAGEAGADAAQATHAVFAAQTRRLSPPVLLRSINAGMTSPKAAPFNVQTAFSDGLFP